MSQINPEILQSLQLAAQTAQATAEACLLAIAQLQQEQNEARYVSLEAAATALGDGISAEMLKDRCKDGRFEHGKHFINSSDGDRPNYLIRVSAVRKYLETDPSRRKPPKR